MAEEWGAKKVDFWKHFTWSVGVGRCDGLIVVVVRPREQGGDEGYVYFVYCQFSTFFAGIPFSNHLIFISFLFSFHYS